MSGLRIRPAARAVVLDDDDRILLVRFEFPAKTLWATPGGGVEPGESHEGALRRELWEEAGMADPGIGAELWTRLHLIPFVNGLWDGQAERFFLVRTPPFEPVPQIPWVELNAEYVFAIRWWTLDELERARVPFAPSRLPALLRALLADGPPVSPLEIEV